MPPALVSFGLPVYNGAEFVSAAIESVLSQTYPHIELIISDNNSTDATDQICRQFAQRDQRVRYFRASSNQGAAANYNRVVDLARGKYFKWISHDDWIDARFSEECLLVAEKNDEIITVAPIVDVVDQAGNKQQSITSYTGREDWSGDRVMQYAQMMEELAYCETHGDGLFMIAYEYGFHRLSLLRKTRLVLPFISSDYVLAAELALWGKLEFLNKHLSVFVLSAAATGTTANFISWNPYRIQHMLSPARTGALDLLISVRRRHFEHIRAVLRSPLSIKEKARAMPCAIKPMLARIKMRTARSRGQRSVK
jgi:glycosyltransferase involved in cell wall biosynthesis